MTGRRPGRRLGRCELLILGGTVFLGRHLAALALARGHTLTLFHRGKHGADLFPEAAHVFGDRDGGLGALAGGRWDAAIDTCGYVPRVVRDAATALATAVEHYTFVSTLSVHDEDSRVGRTEDASTGTLDDPTVETIDGATYGPLKRLCEEAAETAMPGRVLVVRPGLIVGPHDPSDRFTYWPVRMARGGEVLAPEHPDLPVQLIDVRDLAAWMLDLVEQGTCGTYNATGLAAMLTMGEVLETGRAVGGAQAAIRWVDRAFLEAQEVAPYLDLPLWIPDTPAYAGSSTFDCTKARDAGLAFRPLWETVADTLAWARERAPDHPWRAGLAPERERALLEAWRERS